MSNERKHSTPPEKTTSLNRDVRKGQHDDNNRKSPANASGSPDRDASTIDDAGCGCAGLQGTDMSKKRSTQVHSGEVPGRDEQD